jgi:hypothetical protein
MKSYIQKHNLKPFHEIHRTFYRTLLVSDAFRAYMKLQLGFVLVLQLQSMILYSYNIIEWA